MADPTPFARMWGAVMTEDGPIAEVRDVSTREEFDALLASDVFRVWAMASLRFPMSREGHSRGPCLPGAPCAKCHKGAQAWWWEHGRRTKARYYMAAHAKARFREGFHRDEWGERRENKDDAIRDAQARGFAFVVLMNGHGRKLDWIEVPNV